jgi:hypothetical protein
MSSLTTVHPNRVGGWHMLGDRGVISWHCPVFAVAKRSLRVFLKNTQVHIRAQRWIRNWVWWCTPVISVFWSLGQKVCEFQAYIERPCLKKGKSKSIRFLSIPWNMRAKSRMTEEIFEKRLQDLPFWVDALWKLICWKGLDYWEDNLSSASK